MPISPRCCSSKQSQPGWPWSASTRTCPTGSIPPISADIKLTKDDGTRRKEEPGVRPNLPWLPMRAFGLGAAVLSMGVLAACSSSSSSSTTSTSTSSSASASASSSTPISIGASLSLTGDFSADGQAFQKGYQLWAKDVNAAGGIDGRQVKLTFLNDASSPNQVVTNYQTLINTDHVNLTFGPFSSLLTGPASAVAARRRYAFIEGG